MVEIFIPLTEPTCLHYLCVIFYNKKPSYLFKAPFQASSLSTPLSLGMTLKVTADHSSAPPSAHLTPLPPNPIPTLQPSTPGNSYVWAADRRTKRILQKNSFRVLKPRQALSSLASHQPLPLPWRSFSPVFTWLIPSCSGSFNLLRTLPTCTHSVSRRCAHSTQGLPLYGIYSLFFLWAVPHVMRDLSSLPRDRTRTPCSGSRES